MAGLYIHIPYCRSKCAYCDFFSITRSGEAELYVEALLNEWARRKHELGEEPVTTVYIGGGTPSLLDIGLMARLVDGLSNDIDIDSVEEFTIEANPEDISTLRINDYKSLGINRISIGVQSFDDEELRVIGRKHSSEASLLALDELARASINFNADLIYGLPGQTLLDWQSNLDRMLSFVPNHLSCYLLSYEPQTRLYAMRERGVISECSDNLALEMYAAMCDRLTNGGYRHYEISNSSLPGFEAKHNSSYWNYTPYLGLGVTAHSFDGKYRRANPAAIKRYIDCQSSADTDFFVVDEENEANRFNDYIITSLRTIDGFSRSFAAKNFSQTVIAEFNDNLNGLLQSPVNEGAMAVLCDGDKVIIPERHWLVMDAILRQLIV